MTVYHTYLGVRSCKVTTFPLPVLFLGSSCEDGVVNLGEELEVMAWCSPEVGVGESCDGGVTGVEVEGGV